MNRNNLSLIKFIIFILLPGIIISFVPIMGILKFVILISVCIVGYLLFSTKKNENTITVVENTELEKELESNKEIDSRKAVNTIEETIKIVTNNFVQLKTDLDTIISKEKNNINENNVSELSEKSLSILESILKNSESLHKNVSKSHEISDNLSKSAKEAFDLSDKVQSGIKIITKNLNDTLNYTTVLNEQSLKISRILEIMSDISDKIHILSINASIVSARAGAHGKGFKIVSKEIRKLAKETEGSVNEIDQLIKNIRESIINVVNETKKATDKTKDETEALINVAGSLQGLQLAIEIINTVNGVSKEKAEQLSKALENLNSIIINITSINKEKNTTELNLESCLENYEYKFNLIKDTLLSIKITENDLKIDSSKKGS